MPLTKPVRITVLPGDGAYPQVLRQLFGFDAEPSQGVSSWQSNEIALLLCPSCPSSLNGRAAMYSKGIRFAATHLLSCQKASLTQILSILAGEPCEDDKVFQEVHWKTYLNLPHDLRSLFCYPYWFAFNPVDDEGARVERYHRRLSKLKAYLVEMKSLVGSQYEADCIGGILGPFVAALEEWFGSRDLRCHPEELGAHFFQQLNAPETSDHFQRFREYIVNAPDNPIQFNRENLRIYSVIQSALEKSL